MKYIGKHNAFDELLIGPVLFTFPDAASFYQLTLPVDDGSSGQVLATDGNGVLSWVANGVAVPNALTIGVGVDLASGNTSWDGSAAETLNLDLTEVIATDGANRLLTSDGDGTLTAEANATFDGSTLSLSTSKVFHTYGADGGTDFAYLLSASTNEQDNSTLVGFCGSINRGSNNINAGQTAKVKGFYQTVDDAASGNIGNSHLYGIHQLMSFSGTGGNTEGYGIHTTLIGGDVGSNIGLYQKINDGGFDVKFVSSANENDSFSISTKAAGETLMTTTDSSSHAADLTFNIDGDIFLDNDGFGLTKITSDGVEIENSATSGAHALTIDNNDVDQHALLIEAANTTGHILDIEAGALTTADAIHVKADALTTGAGLHLDINDSVTTTFAKSLIKLDYDKTGIAATGQLQQPKGLEISMTDSVTNVGFVNMTGIDLNMDHSSTGGVASSIGIDIDMNGGDATTGMTILAATTGISQTIDDSTGTELRFRSSANAFDSFTVNTGTNGETTLTTVDWDAALAHMNLVADGNIVLDAAGTIELNADGNSIMFKDGSTEVMEVTSNTLKLISMQGLSFEGTPDSYETIIDFIDPTADRTITLPNASGTVALTSAIPTVPTDTVTTGAHIHTQTKVTIDATACNGLSSSPVTLVAAQGADTIIVPVSVTVLLDRNSADSSGADLIVGYNGTTNYQYAIRYMRRFMLGITTDMQFNMVPYFNGHGANSLTGGTNVPLTMSTSAPITAGSLTSMVVYTSYYVIDK
jgi:hypothetical protein